MRLGSIQENLNDYIGTVMLYNEASELIYSSYHQALERSNQIQIFLDRKPFNMVLGPYLMMMDKSLEDNQVVF